MTNKKSTRFIDFLDSYDKKMQCNYLEYTILNTAIQNNIHEQKLTDLSFSGKRYEYITNKKCQFTDISDNSFYSIHNSSIWNKTNDPFHLSFPNQYSIWQKDHEADIILPNSDQQIIKTKTHLIDISINSLDDILSIIKNNEYQDDVEYNIDLKSLHNIKEELIELNSMIGIQTMKKSILDQLIYFIQELHLDKEKETSDFKHTVLYGPPGTGKTEIAKIIGRMYSKLGILKKNVFKKATRSELIAGYLGQTAIKTKKMIDECLGGVLFIDEAYSLANGDREDSYSKECLDTLCEALSDHKNDLMVIIAGYEDELNETFFRVNKGLESRFIWRFTMEEYSSKELMEIFKKKINDIEWSLECIDETKLQKWFEYNKTNFKHFGRDMELLLTYVKIAHGRRIYMKNKELRKNINFDDIEKGYDVFMKNKKTKKEPIFMNSIYI
uniref:AAA+ ATPase domain-containing protein n=1 Tax=viral metagenome TaxID=1070528 RepID=A0A6C0DBZ2_9ZZZZ